jgi:hypothetical protein
MKTEEDEEFERIEAESGWRKKQIALDQKAENAREMGLNYEQESVAWEQFHEHMVMPFYTAPPQRTWVGLTDEEIEQGHKDSWITKQAFESAVWWAEAKLKDKNT